ncbi:tautomerase family protein [Streptomyces olivaceoviridis]|uniref:tautomerase family protein n=1 Tax=Streptomyces olivaceoviridis TaxID=1921 RepID=UPI00332B0C2F
MPFVRIDTLGTDPARLDALGQAVQDALVQTLGVPPEDRFQVLTGHNGVTSTVRHGDPATLVETICRRWKIEEAFQRRRRSRHDPAYRPPPRCPFVLPPPTRDREHALRWTAWRRRHQATAQACHQQRHHLCDRP